MEETNHVIWGKKSNQKPKPKKPPPNLPSHRQANKSNLKISSEYLCIADKYIKQLTGPLHVNLYDWPANSNEYEKGNIPCINIWNTCSQMLFLCKKKKKKSAFTMYFSLFADLYPSTC